MSHIINVLGEWDRFIDHGEARKLLPILINLYEFSEVCPAKENVFRAFNLTTPDECKVVFIGQDPYPQRGVATGVLFGNKVNTPESEYSPSLKVIRNSIKDLENSNLVSNFDPSLESWAKQGILMLNSSLTVEVNRIGSHTMIWRRFIAKFINNLSRYNDSLIYVLFGELAQTFSPYIFGGTILKVKHPAYYARTNTPMPSNVFNDINTILDKYGTSIEWC